MAHAADGRLRILIGLVRRIEAGIGAIGAPARPVRPVIVAHMHRRRANRIGSGFRA
jgi:hypothetical protein